MVEILLKPKGEIGIMVEAEVINPVIFAGNQGMRLSGLLSGKDLQSFLSRSSLMWRSPASAHQKRLRS